MSKIIAKIKEKREEKAKGPNITQQNLEESREEIIAKGKKFKYPFQYAKHKLIFNALLIGVIAIAAFAVVGWLQLYRMHNTSEVMYRFTRTIPLSVAEVDNVKVRFSDYLMLYRSSIRSIERQQGEFDDSDDSRAEKNQYMRQALTDAEDYSYAMAKLAEIDKAVTDEEIDAVIKEHKTIDGELRSDTAFEGIVRDNFGLTINEYRRLIMLSLARKKVSIELDETAKKKVTDVAEAIVNNGKDFKKVAAAFSDDETIVFEEVMEVDLDNLDNGRAAMAAQLENVGEVSEKFVSKNGDGYYFVKLTAKDENKVSYQSIWVRFTWFDEVMQKLRDENKVHEKISIEIEEKNDEEVEAESGETEEPNAE